MLTTVEKMQVRVLQKENPFDSASNTQIRIELSCPDDLQFFYTWNMNDQLFQNFRVYNHLNIELGQFLDTLTQLFSDYESRPHMYKVVFTMEDENANACLTFY